MGNRHREFVADDEIGVAIGDGEVEAVRAVVRRAHHGDAGVDGAVGADHDERAAVRGGNDAAHRPVADRRRAIGRQRAHGAVAGVACIGFSRRRLGATGHTDLIDAGLDAGAICWGGEREHAVAGVATRLRRRLDRGITADAIDLRGIARADDDARRRVHHRRAVAQHGEAVDDVLVSHRDRRVVGDADRDHIGGTTDAAELVVDAADRIGQEAGADLGGGHEVLVVAREAHRDAERKDAVVGIIT